MTEQLRVTPEDDVLAEPISGATWSFDDPHTVEAPAPEVTAPEEQKFDEPAYNKRTEVTKILTVVVVGTLAGILGGVTLAKYGIGSSEEAPSVPVNAPVVASTVKPQTAAVPASVPAPASIAPAAQAGAGQPGLMQASAVQPVQVAAPPSPTSQQVLGVYAQKKEAATEVIVFLAAPVEVKPEKLANPNRLFFDLPNAEIASSALVPVAHLNDGLLKKVRTGRSETGATRLVFDVKSGFSYKYSVSKEAPYRLTISMQAE
jgi:hypothetical protein